jgi:predicted amidohydrolase
MTTSLVFAVQAHVSDVPAGQPHGPVWQGNIQGAIALVEAAARRHGSPNLVVLPAYVVTGIPTGLRRDALADQLPTVPCSDAMALAELAQRHQAYVVSSTIEFDPETPEDWYITAFLLDPAGEVILRYRQVTPPSVGALAGAGIPDDDAPLRELFPVADTPLGRIGLCIGADASSPELVRALLFNGAEIICHVTDEPGSAYRAGARTAR